MAGVRAGAFGRSLRSGSTVDWSSSPSIVLRCAKPSKPATREKRLMAATDVPVNEAISSALCERVRIGCEDIHRPTRDSEGEASSTADSIRLRALCTDLNESIRLTCNEWCHSHTRKSRARSFYNGATTSLWTVTERR